MEVHIRTKSGELIVVNPSSTADDVRKRLALADVFVHFENASIAIDSIESLKFFEKDKE